jgi:hypothetical protein
MTAIKELGYTIKTSTIDKMTALHDRILQADMSNQSDINTWWCSYEDEKVIFKI